MGYTPTQTELRLSALSAAVASLEFDQPQNSKHATETLSVRAKLAFDFLSADYGIDETVPTEGPTEGTSDDFDGEKIDDSVPEQTPEQSTGISVDGFKVAEDRAAQQRIGAINFATSLLSEYSHLPETQMVSVRQVRDAVETARLALQ